MTEKNWALAEHGAKVDEVSHEASHVASSATNLLMEREDLLWITGDAPQHVTLRLRDAHPPLRYVGWHVWHDYLTNPKTVEVASGPSAEEMTALLVCHALGGAGTQLWKLPSPIPAAHRFVRLTITATFGPGPTYMNHVVLFANDPGPRFRSASVGGEGERKGNPAARVSDLLRELDEDIRALHPIKTVSPKRNMLLYVPPNPVALPEEPEMEAKDDDDDRRPQRAAHSPQTDVPRAVSERLAALERAVASLTQTVSHQREDLTLVKRLLLQQAAQRRRETHVARHQVAVDFPQEALRAFVESILGPKLHKHARRTETHTMAKLDTFLKDVVTEITHAVDERVRSHLRNGRVAERPTPNASFPTRTAAFGVTPSTSGACSPHRHETGIGSVPLSIIRDMSTEVEPVYQRHTRAPNR